MNITRLTGANAYRANAAAKPPKNAKQTRNAVLATVSNGEVSSASVSEVSVDDFTE